MCNATAGKPSHYNEGYVNKRNMLNAAACRGISELYLQHKQKSSGHQELQLVLWEQQSSAAQ